jgi:hypothetical protein
MPPSTMLAVTSLGDVAFAITSIDVIFSKKTKRSCILTVWGQTTAKIHLLWILNSCRTTKILQLIKTFFILLSTLELRRAVVLYVISINMIVYLHKISIFWIIYSNENPSTSVLSLKKIPNNNYIYGRKNLQLMFTEETKKRN